MKIDYNSRKSHKLVDFSIFIEGLTIKRKINRLELYEIRTMYINTIF